MAKPIRKGMIASEDTVVGKIAAEGSLKGTLDKGAGFTSPQNKEVIPDKDDQRVTPDNGYDTLGEVIVKGVPYAETQNAAGGITVKIG